MEKQKKKKKKKRKKKRKNNAHIISELSGIAACPPLCLNRGIGYYRIGLIKVEGLDEYVLFAYAFIKF